MSREDIIRMAQEAIIDHPNDNPFDFRLCRIETIERFAALVAAAERERIIAANAPEIEKINKHFKTLEDALAAERERCAELCDSIAANSVLGTANECAVAIRARSKV